MRRLRDPFASSLVVLGALASGGLAVLVMTWRGVAGDASVANQVPFLVSGGIGGLALVGFAVGLLAIQCRRWREARRRADYEELLKASAQLLAVVRHNATESQR